MARKYKKENTKHNTQWYYVCGMCRLKLPNEYGKRIYLDILELTSK